MSPTYNMTEADETSFDDLPRGDYLAEVAEIDEDGVTSEDAAKFPNCDMTKITFNLLQDGYENRNQWLNLIWPDPDRDDLDAEDSKKQVRRSVGRVKQLCRASGQFSEDELESPSFELDWADLIGAKVTLSVSFRKGRGNSITKILPPDDSEAEELP